MPWQFKFEGLWSPWLLLDFEQQTQHTYSLSGKPSVVVFSSSKWSGGFSSHGVRAGLRRVKWNAVRSRKVGLKQTRWGPNLSDVWGKFEQFNPCHSEISLLMQQSMLLTFDNSGSLSYPLLKSSFFFFLRNIFCSAELPKVQNSFRSCRLLDPLGKIFCLWSWFTTCFKEEEKLSVSLGSERWLLMGVWHLCTPRFLIVCCYNSVQCEVSVLQKKEPTKAQIPLKKLHWGCLVFAVSYFSSPGSLPSLTHAIGCLIKEHSAVCLFQSCVNDTTIIL